ncbi:class I adenylate-forming enzyme family protein [Streptomyces sp. NPDC055078]
MEAVWGFGDQVFLVGAGGSWTYREFFAAAAALARRFVEEYGLRPGERAALVMGNCPEWQIVFWAAQLAGLVAVPLDVRWSAEELVCALDDCAPGVLLVDGKVLPKEMLPEVEDWRRRAGARAVVFHRGSGWEDGVDRYEDFGAPDPHGAPPAVEVRAEDGATIVYTAGAGGRLRGAVATQFAQAGATVAPRFHATVAALESGRLPGLGPAPVVLMAMPFPEPGAFTAVYWVMGVGGTLVLMPEWDAADALALVGEHRVTHFSGTPDTVRDLREAARRAGGGTETLVAAMVTVAVAEHGSRAGAGARGGPAPGPGAVEAWTGYGAAETCGYVLVGTGNTYRAAPDVEVRITGPGGEELPEGGTGELWLRGQSLVRGYWRDEESTAEAFRDGWFRTGDLAAVRDGWVTVVGRGGG